MSTYSQDFNEYTVSAAPSDWTNRWASTWTTNVITNSSDAYGDKVLELNGSANARRLLSWDDIDGDANRDDCEILVRHRLTSASALEYTSLFHCRASGSAGSETSYNVRFFNNSNMEMVKTVSGSSTILDEITAPSTFFDLDSRWVWTRFRVNGTSIKAKLWDTRIPEPNRWHTEATDSAISAAGWIGVGDFDSDRTGHIDFFSVGTNGDTAPYPASDADAVIRNYKMYVEVATLDAPAGDDYHMPTICINS